MPRYTKDRSHAVNDAVLKGDAPRQFEAIWEWMRRIDRTP
jgi:hypothetical protein